MIRALFACGMCLGSLSVGINAHAANPCANARRINACGAAGAINVAGRRDASDQPKGNIPAQVGATQYVSCEGDAASELQALGDPYANDDALNCTTWKPDCDAVIAKDHKPRTVSIRVQLQSDGKWHLNGGGCYPAAKPSVTPTMVAEHAVRLIPTAAIGLAPKATTLVNMQTIMWVDAPAKQTLPTATILGKQVRITLVLDHVSWNFGDGQTDTATSPGKRYDAAKETCNTRLCAGYYGHVYADTGARTVTATAAWRATFSVGNGPPTAIPGTINGPTATSTLRVREARTVLVEDPHD